MAGFKEAGTFARPRLLGRAIRLVAGVGIFYLVFPPFLRHYDVFTRVRAGWETPGGTWWIALLLTLYLLPHFFDVGLGLHWGSRSQSGFGVLAGVAAAVDYLLNGSLWGPRLGWFLMGTFLLVLGHLSVSFLVAGIFATPG